MSRLPATLHDRLLRRLPSPTGEDGFLLIEALISAVLVAVIVIGTFNGFDAANRSGADERAHNEAVLLAEQSQEQMRSDPVTVLDKLQTASHSYTTTVDGTEYTVTQEASPSNGTAETSCNVTEVTKQTAGNVLITSKVSWALLKAKPLKTERPAVSLSSIITPPTGSGLEIDVGNEPAPTAGVSGVTAIVTYVPTGSSTPTTVEGTTNTNGCYVFEGIPSTAASVAINEKAGYVTPAGTLKPATKEVSVAANITTHIPETFNQGGAIKALFTYKGKSTYEGKTVTGDTFVAFNKSMNSEPNFEVGSAGTPGYELSGEEKYTAATGTYASSALTPKGLLYSNGDLFPFISSWAVYAGDCRANNPSNYSLSFGSATVTAAGLTEVSIPMSIINLAVREGTKASPGSLNSEALTTKITDTACSSEPTPNNAAATNLVHEQKTKSGALTYPFMPFGAYSLAIERSKKRYTITGENTTEAGTSPTIYLGARTQSEIASSISTDKAEITTDATKISTLEAAKKTEEEAKKTRETKEAEERAQWKKETTECVAYFIVICTKYKITVAEEVAKVNAQTETRKADETKEKEKATTRAAELKAAEEAKKTAETNLKTAETEQKEEEESHVKVEATS